MTFKQWIKENCTSTADVAGFQRPIFGDTIKRKWAGPWGQEDSFFDKKKRIEKHK